MNYCTTCGHRMEPGHLFCTGCGADRRPGEPADSAPPQPVLPPYQPTVTSDPAPASLFQAPTPLVPPHQVASDADGLPPSGPADRGADPDRAPRQGRIPRSGHPLRAGRDDRPRPRQAGPRSRRAIVAGVVLVAVGCGAAVAMMITRPSSTGPARLSGNAAATPVLSQSSQQQPTAQPTAQAPSQSPTSGPPTEQTGAQALSQLLAQSTSDRSSIVAAYNDVLACGSSLAGDARAFQQAAASRKSLLSQLGTLTDENALPTPLLQALSGAWQASYQVDQDYTAWVADESSHGCTASDTSDPNFQAAEAPNNEATAHKTAFVNQWNPIAAQYDLPTYQQNQL